MVEEGYTFAKYDKKQQMQQMKKLDINDLKKSPLELIHEQREQERLDKEEMESFPKKASPKQKRRNIELLKDALVNIQTPNNLGSN